MTVGLVQSPHWTSASSGLASTDSLALFVFLETDVLVPRVSSKDAKVVDDTLCSAVEEVGRVRDDDDELGYNSGGTAWGI